MATLGPDQVAPACPLIKSLEYDLPENEGGESKPLARDTEREKLNWAFKTDELIFMTVPTLLVVLLLFPNDVYAVNGPVYGYDYYWIGLFQHRHDDHSNRHRLRRH